MWEKKWIHRQGDAVAADLLVESGIPALAAKVLSARKFRTPQDVAAAFTEDTSKLHNPKTFAGMADAVERLRRAVESHEKIAVYGDYDVDGIMGVTLLVEWLRDKGADCVYYIPERQEEGFGVTNAAISTLASDGVTLIVTVDTGITAADEVAYAATIGVDIIVTDHHSCPDDLPNAAAVVDPRRSDCRYPFKYLAGVGVAFMLAWAYDGCDTPDGLIARHGDLVAIGTIADVVPLVATNRILTANGLRLLAQTRREGLKALLRETQMEGKRISEMSVGFTLAPRINAAGRMGSAIRAVDMLLTDNPDVAEQGARYLCELNRRRQKVENDLQEEINAEAERQISGMDSQNLPGVLVLSSDRWHQGIVGIVASRLSERYACPVFLVCVENGIGKGSARSFFGVSIIHMMRRAAYLLESWGGHELAVGFTIKEERIPMFRELLLELSHTLSPAHVEIDAELSAHELEPENILSLKMLEPYGPGNMPPLFLLRDVRITELVEIGAGKSTRMTLVKDGRTFSALYYGRDPSHMDICDGDCGEVLVHADLEQRGGRQELLLLLSDMRMPREIGRQYRRALDLYDQFVSGEDMTPDEARHAMPTKHDFVALLRHLRRNCNDDGVYTARIGSMCRRICREEHLDEGYARILICLLALDEKGRLEYTRKGEFVTVKLCDDAQVNLNDSCVLQRLYTFMRGEADGNG